MEVFLTSLATQYLLPSGDATVHVQGCPLAYLQACFYCKIVTNYEAEAETSCCSKVTHK
jgi:hypothetical protein